MTSKGKNILAIVGMAGSGKSEVIQFAKEKGFPCIRFGEETDRGLMEAGLPLTEENERVYREKLRKELGMAAYAIKAKPFIDEVLAQGNVVFLDGLYTWEEYLYLRETYRDLLLIAIVANRANRYDHLKKRSTRPLMPKESYERDVAEIEHLNKAPAIAIADYVIENNGTLDELKEKTDALLQRLGLV